MLSRRRSKQFISLVTCFILAFTILFPLGVAADQRVAYLSPDSMDEHSLDQAELNIYFQGDRWGTEFLSPQYITLNGQPEGLTVTNVVYGDPEMATVMLSYTGPGLEEDILDFSMTINGQALASGHDITTSPIMILAQIEDDTDADKFIVNSMVDTVDVDPGDGVCADEFGECTLRAAIMEANALSGEQTIQLSAGRYEIRLAKNDSHPDEFHADLDITDDLVIIGSGQEETVIGPELDSWIGRVFEISAGVSVKMSHLKITGGMASSGTYSEARGGGIYNSGNLELDHVNIADNASYYEGGGIYSEGPLTIRNSKIYNNGEYFYAPDTEKVSNGGGIYHTGADQTLTIIDSEISSNKANYAGGIYITGGANAVIGNSLVIMNIADDDGGIYVDGSILRIEDTQIVENSALNGGAGGLSVKGFNVDSKIDISGSQFIENTTAGDGGAIYVTYMSNGDGYVHVQSSEFVGNQAEGSGGLLAIGNSVQNYYTDIVVIEESIIEGNSAGVGEAIISNDTSTTIDARYNYWGAGGPDIARDSGISFFPYYKDQSMQELAGPSDLLSDLVVTGGKLYPAFDPEYHEYVVLIDYDVESISITPHTNHEEAWMMLNEEKEAISGQPVIIELEHGLFLLMISVAGPNDTEPTNTYVIMIMKEQYIEVNTFEDTVDIDPNDGLCADENGRCSLRAAVMHTTDSGIVSVISLAAGEYKLKLTGEEWSMDPDSSIGDLDVNMPIRIIGAGSDSTIIDASEINDRVFEVSNATLDITGVTIQGGSTYENGGAIYYRGCQQYCEGDVELYRSTLADVVIADNSAARGGGIMLEGYSLSMQDVEIRDNLASDGGAIYVTSSAELVTEQTKVLSNTAESKDGGAIYNVGSVKLFETELIGNRALDWGGAIFSSSAANTEITDSLIEDNQVYLDPEQEEHEFFSEGGALTNFGTMVINGTTLRGNAAHAGGAIFNDGPATLTIKGSEFSENKAIFDGGAVFNAGWLTIEQSSFEDNAGRNGAGVLNVGHMLMQRSTLSGNNASKLGGGIMNGGQMNVEDTSVVANEAGENGGGIHAEILELYKYFPDSEESVVNVLSGIELADNHAVMHGGGMSTDVFTEIQESTFHGNRAGETGGGLRLTAETHIVNGTFANNEAGIDGGGILATGPWLTLSHSTISDNTLAVADGGLDTVAGGLMIEAESTFIANSILYGNDAVDVGQAIDCTGNIYPLGVNIIGSSGCQVTGDEEGIVLDVDPRLGELADHGGKVKTMALLPGSPAIDGARVISDVSEDMAWVYHPVSDARQVSRPQSIAGDIGAYEVEMQSYSFLALYDSDRDEVLIRVGSELNKDIPLIKERFEVLANSEGETIKLDIKSAHYGEDSRTVILKLGAHERLDGSTMNVIMGTDAVRFVEKIYVFKSEAEMMTKWQVRDAVVELLTDEIEDVSDIDVGIIVRALAEGTLAELLGLSDSQLDPAIVRFILSLIETKYVSTINQSL